MYSINGQCWFKVCFLYFMGYCLLLLLLGVNVLLKERELAGAGLLEANLVTKELLDLAHTELDHGRTLEGKSPSNHTHTLGQTEGLEHLWAEHSTVTNLGPLLAVFLQN